ncbi:hypothetical protein KKD80_02700 [Patescibacteria group bacterium]|nr:hypothetical protein [Patescibacteria group bacterium]
MEWKELERYRPIPKGGLKLLGLLFIIFLFAAVCLFLSQTNWEGSPMVVVGRIVGYLVIVAIGVLLFNPPLYFWRLRGYWRLNILSYDACFWIKNDEGVDPDIGVQIIERHRSPYWMPCELNERGKTFLRVPLGGLFRKRGQLFGVMKGFGEPSRVEFRAWRVIVRQPVTDPLTDSCIEVVDNKGDRVPLTVSETLRFAAWIGSGGIQEWRHEVPDLLRAFRESRAELAEVRRERDEAKKRVEALEGELGVAVAQREDALTAIDNTIIAIDATKRFKHHPSKEAMRIREAMIRDLLHIAPLGHPLRERYEKFDAQRAAS